MEKQTPLYKAVTEYIERDTARFHMPGHKGLGLRASAEKIPFSDAYRFDITEVTGADSLYEAKGCIAETEKAYAAAYGAKRSMLSAGGSTLCIQTMLALAAKPGAKVVAGRNLHVSAINAMALLGLEPVWVMPDDSAGCAVGGRILPQDVMTALKETQDVCAVYITTPDYFGIISDVRAIADVCRSFNVPLLVDNAHGAHLKFILPSRHPIDLGAAMCCDSLHKSMPVLTGGALLHINDEKYIADAKEKMSLFGSTSPSYLILISCDVCLSYIEKGEAQEEFETVCQRVAELEKLAVEKDFCIPEGERDYTKLVLSVKNFGISADEFKARLRVAGIEPEFVNDVWAVLMASPENIGGDFRRVEKFLNAWELKANSLELEAMPQFTLPRRMLPLREAALSASEEIPVDKSVGRIAAAVLCSCPPCVPLVMPGEEITYEAVELLKSSGKTNIKVVL